MGNRIKRDDSPETGRYKPFSGRSPDALLLADPDYRSQILEGPLGQEVRRLRRENGPDGRPASFSVAVNMALANMADDNGSSPPAA